MAFSLFSLKILGSSTNKSLSFLVENQTPGLLRGLWGRLEWVFLLCVCKWGHGREKETEYSVQRLI